MRRIDWDAAMRSLVLIHIGQQLGAGGRWARMVFEISEIAIAILR